MSGSEGSLGAALDEGDTNSLSKDNVCKILDKLVLKQLHLMEDKMDCEMRIEANVNSGCINLAKARYIMGHTAVSATKLPNEGSTEFAPSTFCEEMENEKLKQLKLAENSENTVNPLHWFGVLVPQNLHKATTLFRHAVGYAVDCVNVQLQMNSIMENIELLREYKKSLSN